MPELKPGGIFPPPDDVPRLERYKQARYLLDGHHADHISAKRINQKLKEAGNNSEGIVYIVLNFPEVIASKFADLQVLRPSIITLDNESDEGTFRDILEEDVPDLNARLHYAIKLKRSLGDGVLLVSRDAGKDVPGKGIVAGGVDLRVADPSTWFPIRDEADSLKFTAHQIAWVEDIKRADKSNETKAILRVDYFDVGLVRHLAFELKGDHRDAAGNLNVEQFNIVAPMSVKPWGLVEEERAEEVDDFLCIHIPNGRRLEPGNSQLQHIVSPFGRSDYEDSGGIFDEVSWRLSTWSDANDKVSHPPRIIPKQYQQVEDEQYSYGRTQTPSTWTAEFLQTTQSGEAGEIPQYMGFELAHETLKDQFEQAFLMCCIRHEMAPALLGYQMGNEKESGEAKSLGMGVTEAACYREQLQLVPGVNRALNVAARLRGIDSKVSTHWRTGLPKSETELIAEVQQLRAAKLITQREAIERLNPHMSEAQIDAKLEELKAERDEETQRFMDESPFSTKIGAN